MLNIPFALQTQFETSLRNTAIPKHEQAAYIKWLRYYLDFCQKYHLMVGGVGGRGKREQLALGDTSIPQRPWWISPTQRGRRK